MSNLFRKLIQYILGTHPRTYTGWEDTKGNVPRWVEIEVKRIRKCYGGTSSSFLDKYWIVKGHHYIYKIQFLGQGGYLTSILKKRR
ncbi:MAG: hypothetical protein PHQ86_07530 [Dehalococcoidales bacterium]|nr:hypothetical protein [Dehalococcoidales bacterium]